MTLLALALLNPLQESLQKSITFEARAARASVLIPELAKAAGVALDVAPAVGNEVLLVSAKGVPLQELLDKIAIVASGEWRQEGETLRLLPSNVARNREIQEENARRLAAVRKEIAERVKALEPKKGSAAEDEMAQAARFMGGEEKSITLLLRTIDPAPIAALNGGDRVVYSTQPTQVQRPLASGVGPIIATLVREHNDTVAKMPKDGEMGGELDKMPDFVKEMIARRTKKIENPQKALLIVSKPSMAGIMEMTQLELRLYDGQGKVAYSGTSMLGSPMRGLDIEIPGQPKKPKPAKQTEIQYSADSKSLMSTLQGASLAGMNIKIEPALMEKLRRPDNVDPLSYMATDELLTLGKAKGKSIVANVPDELMSSINFLVPNGKQTLEDFEEDLKDATTATISETTSWIVVKPARPSESRSNRTDRIALAALIKATQSKGLASLDDIAAFAQTSPSPTRDGIGMLFSMLLVPGLIQQGMGGMTNWDVVRFYGSLGVQQRQNLAQGGRLPVANMTSVQQSLWRKVVFGTSVNIRTGETKTDDFPFSFALAMMQGGSGDYRQEPTELMPSGLPGAAVLSMNLNTEPMASPVTTGEASPMAFLGVLGADELAMFKMMKEDTNMAAMSAFLPAMDKLRIGERGVYKFTLGLPHEAYVQETLFDNRLPANATVASMNDLPAPFQKLIAERMEALKKSPFGALGSLMGAFGKGPIKP